MKHMQTDVNGFETVECSRCWGEGRYSYCSGYGDTCFKCHGKGQVYTNRGLKARDYLKSLLSLPASEIVPGMLAVLDTISGKNKFCRVIDVEQGRNEGNIRITGRYANNVDFSSEIGQEIPVRIGHTDEAKRQARYEALWLQHYS